MAKKAAKLGISKSHVPSDKSYKLVTEQYFYPKSIMKAPHPKSSKMPKPTPMPVRVVNPVKIKGRSK